MIYILNIQAHSDFRYESSKAWLTLWSRTQNYALSRAALYFSSAGFSLFPHVKDVVFQRNLYHMNHKGLIYLVLLVISNFIYDRPIKNERKVRRDFCTQFRAEWVLFLNQPYSLFSSNKLKTQIKIVIAKRENTKTLYFFWKIDEFLSETSS